MGLKEELREIARHKAQATSKHLEIREHYPPDTVGPESQIEWKAADETERLERVITFNQLAEPKTQ